MENQALQIDKMMGGNINYWINWMQRTILQYCNVLKQLFVSPVTIFVQI